MAYPIDNPFRSPVEFVSVVVSVVAAFTLLLLGHFLGVDRWIIILASLALIILAVWRFRQGLGILRFHRSLRWLPRYSVRSEELPQSSKEMFLGMGFWWTQKHTQRLYLARLPINRHLRARSDRYEWARQFARDKPTHWLTALLNKETPWNPVAPLPPVGGDPAIHGIEPDEGEIWSSRSEKVGHTLVLGTTRVGKTRLAELLITQDIRAGNVVIVFDPKGDVTLLKRMYAEACRAGRQNDFYFFHLGYPEMSDRYSPISSIGRITEVATRVANPLPGEGNSAAFKQFVWLYVNVIARAAAALGKNPTYTMIYQYAADLDGLAQQYFEVWLDRAHPSWREDKANNDGTISEKMLQSRIQQTGRTQSIIELLDLIQKKGWNEDPIANGLSSVLANNKSKYQALINSLFPLLEKLTTGKISELLSPSWDDPTDKRRYFTWERIMDTGGIVYFGLDALSDNEVAAAVGNAAFSDLTSTAGRRYKFGAAYGQSSSIAADAARRVSIHADEFNELIGDEFVPMVNKAGGAGYEITAYTQTWSDVEARIGNAAKAAQIGGNFNTLIMLRVKNIETAELLTEQLPMVEVYSSMMVSGTSDVQNPDEFADFSARSEDRLTAREVAMIQPADLTQLPKGQAFALLEGGQLAKIRLPLPVSDEQDPVWPANLEAVFGGMHAQYERYLMKVDVNDPEAQALAGHAQGMDVLTVEGKGYGH
jgi:conjugal transfer pilus assembly protein TraD